MRKILLAALFLAGVSGAQAADMPDYPLRGGYSPAPLRPMWDGFYVGGQYGYGVSNMDFTNATRDQIARLLSNTVIEAEMSVSQWPMLGKAMSHNSTFGGFAGYNSQFEDVVIGFDFSYMHGKSGGSQTGSMGRSYRASNDYFYNVTASSTASIEIQDFMTARIRGGYMIDNFLPYAFVGGALGIGDITRTASVVSTGTYVGTNVPPLPNTGPNFYSNTSTQPNHLLYGYAAGVGVDVLLIGGLFVRAEYEYLRFTSKIDTDINTVRVGVGYKF